jgi:hypothetical protein
VHQVGDQPRLHYDAQSTNDQYLLYIHMYTFTFGNISFQLQFYSVAYSMHLNSLQEWEVGEINTNVSCQWITLSYCWTQVYD